MARSSHLYVSIPAKAVKGIIMIANRLMVKMSFLSELSRVGIAGVFLRRILV